MTRYYRSDRYLPTAMTSTNNISAQARRDANIKLLRRTCSPNITDILVSATHVVLYEYRQASWHKSGIEGSLFVTVSSNSKYELIILNRNSNDNCQIQLSSNTQIQHHDPYLIIREASHADRIRGIWFHSAQERMTVNETFQSVIERQQTAARSQSAPPARTADRPQSTVASPAPIVDTLNETLAQSAAITSSQSGVALDKKALQLTLLSLIQDDRFLDLLHSRYLSVIQARTSKQQNQGE